MVSNKLEIGLSKILHDEFVCWSSCSKDIVQLKFARLSVGCLTHLHIELVMVQGISNSMWVLTSNYFQQMSKGQSYQCSLHI